VTEITEVSPELEGRLKRGWLELGVFHLVKNSSSFLIL
jgi:hypothetical protein